MAIDIMSIKKCTYVLNIPFEITKYGYLRKYIHLKQVRDE